MTFDGWKGAFDYWTRYDSRDIFPVGWCSRSCHPMQPPGNKFDSSLNKRKSVKQSPSSSTSSTVASSTATASNTSLPDNDSMRRTTPVTVHFHSKCRNGRLIDGIKLRSMVTAPTHQLLGQLCLQEILSASTDTAQLSRLLYGLEGEEHIVTAAGQNFTVRLMSNLPI